MPRPDHVGGTLRGLNDILPAAFGEQIGGLPDEATQALRLVQGLRTRLLQIEPMGPGSGGWDRVTAIQVLTAVGEWVHEVMDEPLTPSADHADIEVVEAHLSSQVLDELSEILRDLSNGKVDKRLRPEKGRRGHGIAMRRMKLEILALVDVVAAKKKHEGVSNYEQRAREDVARAQTSEGIFWPEGRNAPRPIDATLISSWSKRPPL